LHDRQRHEAGRGPGRVRQGRPERACGCGPAHAEDRCDDGGRDGGVVLVAQACAPVCVTMECIEFMPGQFSLPRGAGGRGCRRTLFVTSTREVTWFEGLDELVTGVAQSNLEANLHWPRQVFWW